MLLIDYFVAPSQVHGLGVFAGQSVDRGDRVYQFHPLIDREISADEFADLPDNVRRLVRSHGEYDREKLVFRLSADGVFYMNHADDPNLEDRGNEMFARRAIQIGEELFCDYRVARVMVFDPDTTVLERASPNKIGNSG